MSNDTPNQNPEWLSQVHQFTTDANLGEGDVVRDSGSVGAALGAIADGFDGKQSEGEILPVICIENAIEGLNDAIADGVGKAEMRELILGAIGSLRRAQSALLKNTAPAVPQDAAPASVPTAAPDSLGARLRTVKVDAAAAAAQAAANVSAEAERKRLAAEITVRAFFDAAWSQFTTNILAGNKPGAYLLGGKGDRAAHSVLGAYSWRLPPRATWEQGGQGIWNDSHQYHYLWAEFLAKCAANGLKPLWGDDHDGVGIESWWTLTVDV